MKDKAIFYVVMEIKKYNLSVNTRNLIETDQFFTQDQHFIVEKKSNEAQKYVFDIKLTEEIKIDSNHKGYSFSFRNPKNENSFDFSIWTKSEPQDNLSFKLTMDNRISFDLVDQANPTQKYKMKGYFEFRDDLVNFYFH